MTAALALAAQAFNRELEEAFGVKLKPIAHINNWSEWCGHLIGQVSLHPYQDEFEKPYQMTSKVVARGEGWIETENTRYILGSQECASVQ